jgi:hypothetical protein
MYSIGKILRTLYRGFMYKIKITKFIQKSQKKDECNS